MSKTILRHINKNIGKVGFTILSLFFGVSLLYLFIALVIGHELDRLRWSDGDNPFDELKGLKRHYFIISFYKLLGYISKADGIVSSVEIQVAENFMHEFKLDLAEIILAKNALAAGKSNNFQLAFTLNSFYKKFRMNRGVREKFINQLLTAVLAGDTITPNINDTLFAIAAQVGISKNKLDNLFTAINISDVLEHYRRKNINPEYNFKNKFNKHKHRGKYANPVLETPIAKAYKLLGVSQADENNAVKKAYRRLLNLHHPDKVTGQGGNDEMKKASHEKTILIRQAYELIKERRNI